MYFSFNYSSSVLGLGGSNPDNSLGLLELKLLEPFNVGQLYFESFIFQFKSWSYIGHSPFLKSFIGQKIIVWIGWFEWYELIVDVGQEMESWVWFDYPPSIL